MYILSDLFCTETLLHSVRISISVYVLGAFNKFPDFFAQTFKIVVDS